MESDIDLDDPELEAADVTTGVDSVGAGDRAAERGAALRAFHASLKDPGLRSDDPLVRARALVAVADAKDAYAAAGGSPGSRYADRFSSVYDEARALVAAADAAGA
jgi:hypothetical protein